MQCLVPVSTCRPPRKESRGSTISPQQGLCDGVAISSSGRAPAVTSLAFATPYSRECCTMLGISSPGGRGRSISRTRSIGVPTAASSSMSIPWTTRCPRPPTPIGSWPWWCDWWWRTAYPIKPPAGTCGGITVCSCPSPPSRTGWWLGEKSGQPNGRSYLNWALADVSGYLALDELSDGPFCVSRRQPHL